MRRSLIGVGLVAVLAAGVDGCSSEAGKGINQVAETTGQTTVKPEPPAFSVKDEATDVEPLDPITVKSEAGLEEVEMTNEAGKVIESSFNDDRTEWEVTEPLGYGRYYTIVAKDKAGQKKTVSFSTVVPAATTNVYMGPLEGSTVGVAQAITFRFDVPIHLHTHDTAGGGLATYLAAAAAGADCVDVASAPLSGTTSQPSLSALVAAVANTERDTGLNLDAIMEMEPYWEAVRSMYTPFQSGVNAPTGRVYHHEIPGGQLTNLRAQATALGLADRFEIIEDTYAAVSDMLGRPTKVTPSSKVVGDLALHLVGAGVDPADFAADPQKYDIPDSVISFLRGELGTPPGGWPEPLRSRILEGRGEGHTPFVEVAAEDQELLTSADEAVRRDTLNRLLFPGPTKDYKEARRLYGHTANLTDRQFFYGLREGEETTIPLEESRTPMLVRLDAIGEPDQKGMRKVVFNVNGQIRPTEVRDASAENVTPVAEKADPSIEGHVAAPFAGAVTASVKVGDEVKAGDPVAIIEAMKMEASITATIDGVIGTGNGIQIFPSEYGALVLTLPIGGFITLGCLIALMQYALRKSAEKKEAKEKALAAQEKEVA